MDPLLLLQIPALFWILAVIMFPILVAVFSLFQASSKRRAENSLIPEHEEDDEKKVMPDTPLHKENAFEIPVQSVENEAANPESGSSVPEGQPEKNPKQACQTEFELGVFSGNSLFPRETGLFRSSAGYWSRR